MTIWDFISQHPWFTGIILFMVLAFVCEIVKIMKKEKED